MSARIITGDALTELAKLPSPPYFGLRDYQGRPILRYLPDPDTPAKAVGALL